jgi:hypothetical protein
MTTINRSPKTLGDVIDRIEMMREELFVLQRYLERAEPASKPPQSPQKVLRRVIVKKWLSRPQP